MFSSPPLPRPPRLAALASALSALCLVLAGPGAWAQTTGASAFAMGYFTESPNGLASDYGLHLAVSDDGREWTPLNQNAPVVTPTLGTKGLRDPFILRKQDGTFVVLATDLYGLDFSKQNQFIHVWDSRGLTSFENYRRVKLHELPTHSWAPEAFWDAQRGQYAVIYSAFNGTRDVILVNYTSDFVTFSAAQTYFDPGFNVLDATMHSHGGVNYLYFKRTSDNRLMGARSTSLAPGAFNASIYTRAFDGLGATEAPIVVKSLDRDEWTMWGDIYTPVNGRFFAWRSGNITQDAWEPLSQRLYTQPINSKHATIVALTSAEKSALLSRYGAPAWIRLKSYNYPDRYVRHANYEGRVDPYPMDPYTDSQFRLVGGLASSSGVSLQSVTDPDLYLRHSGFEVRLERDDGSAGFAADATFTRTAGLANASWTTLRSWNYPDRVLRHQGFRLRIDPINASSPLTDREDATFALTR
ncbi:glycoside hydrolase family 43 protein [Cystobacter ferrugineus]|uniref:Alpha-L-arabinofuranosidase n=1 Tax=Cystobacter ferrugineus TaxID=83449 RepID=A0A1L9BI47_9BACT|nr:glycoside hydrolase family 43 protein [Cystobacter ferrugineus]OJH41933.1 alpha-L-arabinofuranosidase [Cystobacter ferrugineus]